MSAKRHIAAGTKPAVPALKPVLVGTECSVLGGCAVGVLASKFPHRSAGRPIGVGGGQEKVGRVELGGGKEDRGPGGKQGQWQSLLPNPASTLAPESSTQASSV